MSAASLVKVYNLTDVSTPSLVQQGLVSQHIVIGDRMCSPGEYVEQVDSHVLRQQLRHLVSVGAISIGALPPPYQQARTDKNALSGRYATARTSHLDIAETKVVSATAAVKLVPVEEVAPVTDAMLEELTAPEPKVEPKAEAKADEAKASKRGK